jgi:DNA-binding PadR family transcriptional regulator
MTMRAEAPDPRQFLPLTPQAFHVLLSLMDGELHGYAIILDVQQRTGGEVKLRTGTLYTILRRLAEEGLITESDARPAADEDDERRRYYGQTPLGRAVVKAEAARLERLVQFARDKHVLPMSRAALSRGSHR